MKDNNFLGMKLSKFVEQSLANGLVPVFEFKDKDSFAISSSEPAISPKDETPIQVLQSEIKFFKNFQLRIETKEGLSIDTDKKEEVEVKLKQLYNDLSKKIIEFEKAIKKLSE